jgi:hypothetical protein
MINIDLVNATKGTMKRSGQRSGVLEQVPQAATPLANWRQNYFPGLLLELYCVQPMLPAFGQPGGAR